MALLLTVQNKEKHLYCHHLLKLNLKKINPKNPLKRKVKSALSLNNQEFLFAMALLIFIQKKKQLPHCHQLLELNLKETNPKNLSKSKAKSKVFLYSQFTSQNVSKTYISNCSAYSNTNFLFFWLESFYCIYYHLLNLKKPKYIWFG